MRIRRLAPPDRDSIFELLQTGGTFKDDEIAVAMELVDLSLAGSHDYHVLVCDAGDVNDAGNGGALLGYLCYGPTPMTSGTYDLYWIASRASARGRGVGTALVHEMERELRAAGARIVRIETSQQDDYDAARSFYARLGYREVGRIRDFYRRGDDLITLARRLDLPVELPLEHASRGEVRAAETAR
jgi:ribosomal protein S18 acetylase RimI-like enzyme